MEKEPYGYLASRLPYYGGSGPAQLALALACDALDDDDIALRVYQALKWRLVGRLPRDGWQLDQAGLLSVIGDILAAKDVAELVDPDEPPDLEERVARPCD